jgi:hypothetical protein
LAGSAPLRDTCRDPDAAVVPTALWAGTFPAVRDRAVVRPAGGRALVSAALLGPSAALLGPTDVDRGREAAAHSSPLDLRAPGARFSARVVSGGRGVWLPASGRRRRRPSTPGPGALRSSAGSHGDHGLGGTVGLEANGSSGPGPEVGAAFVGDPFHGWVTDPSGTRTGCAGWASGDGQSFVIVATSSIVAASSPSPAADLPRSDITSTAPATTVQPAET